MIFHIWNEYFRTCPKREWEFLNPESTIPLKGQNRNNIWLKIVNIEMENWMHCTLFWPPFEKIISERYTEVANFFGRFELNPGYNNFNFSPGSRLGGFLDKYSEDYVHWEDKILDKMVFTGTYRLQSNEHYNEYLKALSEFQRLFRVNQFNSTTWTILVA